MGKTLFTIVLAMIIACANATAADTLSSHKPPRPPRTKSNAPRFERQRDEHTLLTNLVVFIRFADDEEITKSFDEVNQMFNDSTPDASSVWNYFNSMTYSKINYRSVYTNNITGSTIVSYQDSHPRAYYEPYSPSNPIGYEPFPVDAVCPREMHLIAEVLHYIDSMNLVDEDINLDGNNDGYIDNISFILKGTVGNWADLLWPHMEFFHNDQADVPYTVTVNGKTPNAYNFEFENSGYYFSANVFSHEMGHSLGLPDFYHYTNYSNVAPVGIWDQMAQNNMQQVSTILKYKFLNLIDEPVQITEDGTYTLLSNASSSTQNCYYIKSAIDSTQWYTFEFRNPYDFMEDVPGKGLIIGRWVDTMDVNDMYESGNGFFDFHNRAHSYWVFRPGSNIDTVDGQIWYAAFSNDVFYARTSFGPSTDPHPYLTDGTPETSFEITNITVNGNSLTFDVHFFDVGIRPLSEEKLEIYPNPAHNTLNITTDSAKSYEIYDMMGKMIMSGNVSDSQINVSSISEGLYFIKVYTDKKCLTEKFIKK